MRWLGLRAVRWLSSSASLHRWLAAARSREAKKAAALQQQAGRAGEAEQLQQWASLVIANLHRIGPDTRSLLVQDWHRDGQPQELRFASEPSPREQAEAAFRQARRLRRGSRTVLERLERSRAAQDWLERQPDRLAQAGEDGLAVERLWADWARRASELELDPPGGRPRKSEPRPRPGPKWRTFRSPGGCPILVGKSSRQNEQLSLSVAREPDVWLHARGVPGAHVLLRLSQMPAGQRQPQEACLQMAADLAVFFSEARSESKLSVSLASPKHLIKPAKAPPGAIRLRQELGTRMGRPENVRGLVSEQAKGTACT